MSSINMAPVRRLIRNRGQKREGTKDEGLAKTLFIDRIPKMALFVVLSLVLGRSGNYSFWKWPHFNMLLMKRDL